MADMTLKVSVWRGGDDGEFQEFAVPARENQTILDVVTWIQQNLDATLTYRFACRVGMCGSCAMMVNGVPRWTCRTHVNKVYDKKKLTIGPLRNLPVIKDLACDMQPFFDKWVDAGGVFTATKSREDAMPAISPDSQQRNMADQVIECINCAVCYAACDTVANNQEYLGPAALNRSWSLMCDERDASHDARLDAVSGVGGCHNCHTQQSCNLYCPNELNPTASIGSLKRLSVGALLGRKASR